MIGVQVDTAVRRILQTFHGCVDQCRLTRLNSDSLLRRENMNDLTRMFLRQMFRAPSWDPWAGHLSVRWPIAASKSVLTIPLSGISSTSLTMVSFYRKSPSQSGLSSRPRSTADLLGIQYKRLLLGMESGGPFRNMLLSVYYVYTWLHTKQSCIRLCCINLALYYTAASHYALTFLSRRWLFKLCTSWRDGWRLFPRTQHTLTPVQSSFAFEIYTWRQRGRADPIIKYFVHNMGAPSGTQLKPHVCL